MPVIADRQRGTVPHSGRPLETQYLERYMKLVTRILAAVAFGLAAAGSAQAQTATTTFNVTANVTSSCTVSATDLLFGAYTATAASPLDQTSTISVTCTNGENYGI